MNKLEILENLLIRISKLNFGDKTEFDNIKKKLEIFIRNSIIEPEDYLRKLKNINLDFFVLTGKNSYSDLNSPEAWQDKKKELDSLVNNLKEEIEMFRENGGFKESENDSKTYLKIERKKARNQINSRIKKGYGLKNREIVVSDELKKVKRAFYNWSDYNKELLARMFNSKFYLQEYEGKGMKIFFAKQQTLIEKSEEFHNEVDLKIRKLESIRDRLELIPEQLNFSNLTYEKKTHIGKVFIVHGHDEGMKEAVARVLEKQNLKPIILHEKPNMGRTIIEKFEDHSDVHAAIIILSPDDKGFSCKENSKKSKYRARQNVIFEMGFFIGKLGRDKVFALFKKIDNFDIPSDYTGVLYIPYDESWQFKLAKELRASGFEVDLNKL